MELIIRWKTRWNRVILSEDKNRFNHVHEIKQIALQFVRQGLWECFLVYFCFWQELASILKLIC